jgi:hypothetical protein
MHPVFAQLTAATAARYRPAGHFAMNFVRGKLRYDPVYFALLTQGLLPAQGSLLDLGCGRGILMSLLSTARQWASQHGWPEEWACPPVDLRSYGVEIQPARAAEARTALGSEAKVCVADLRCFDPLACHAVILLDVLQYLDYAAQDRLLERISNTLDGGASCSFARRTPGQDGAFGVPSLPSASVLRSGAIGVSSTIIAAWPSGWRILRR